MKRCCRCGQTKEKIFFGKKICMEDGLAPDCRLCRRTSAIKYYRNNTKKCLENGLKYRIASYWPSLTPKKALEEYNKLLELQNSSCGICGGKDSAKRLAVDHDHETGKIRGLLCSKCNRALGYLNDDKELLRKAISYLEK